MTCDKLRRKAEKWEDIQEDSGMGRVTEIPEPILTGKINEFGS